MSCNCALWVTSGTPAAGLQAAEAQCQQEQVIPLELWHTACLPL